MTSRLSDARPAADGTHLQGTLAVPEERDRKVDSPQVFVASLPYLSSQVNAARGWPDFQIEQLAEADGAIAADFEKSLESHRLQWLDEQRMNLATVTNQFCRLAFTSGCDVLILTGATLHPDVMEVLTKFSARFTIIARMQGEFELLENELEDRRHRNSPNVFGLLLSPYENVAFDLQDGLHLDRLKTTFRREHVAEALKVGLRIQNNFSMVTIREADEECSVHLNPSNFPMLASGPLRAGLWLPSHRSLALFDSVDSNAQEIGNTVQNATRSNDPLAYLLELGDKYQDTSLRPRERNALDLLAAARWDGVTQRGPISIFRLPTMCKTDQEIQYKALERWLPAVNNLIALARAKNSQAAVVWLEAAWSQISASMMTLTDLSESARRSADRPKPDGVTGSDHLVFAAHLTSTAGDQLEHSFERQARLLMVLARLTHTRSSLQYSIGTTPDSAGHLRPKVSVECWVHGTTEIDAAALRSSLGELVHSTYVGLHGLSFSFAEGARKAPDRNPTFRAKIRPEERQSEAARLSSFPDWAHVLDLMCSLDKPTALLLTVQPASENAAGSPGPHLSADLEKTATAASDAPSDIKESELEAMLRRVATRVGASHTTVDLEIEIGSHDPIPTALIDLICAEVGGEQEWTYEEAELESVPPIPVPVSEALRIFHPPFGSWYSGNTPRPLSLPSPVSAFPVGGISLGTATILHAKANTRTIVRITDEDRLRHLYVIGRTGSGKTNLLRGLVAQELESPSTGLAIVDPHGDLAGHAINLLPKSRLPDLAVLDFSDPDLTPVLNPLLIDRTSRLARSRLAQEILEVLKARIFHEFSGPRFDSIIRLLLDTLLDAGYPAVPSLVDASVLLTDEQYQRQIRSHLHDEDLKSRWAFHDKLKGGKDYYDLLDWVISKLDDLAQDDTLRSVLGGEANTVDIGRVVSENGILIVSIPESVVGRSTAEFVGSLVLLHVKNALFRRAIRGTVPFFVYVDEFQRFAGAGFEELLAEARKFGVGLVMAHQNIEQLRSFSARTGQSTNTLLNSILGNVGTMVVFPIGSQDAELLSTQIELDPKDVARISRYEAVVKMTLEGQQLSPFTVSTSYAEPGMDPRRLDEIREYLVRHSLMIRRDAVAAQISARREALSPSRKRVSSDRVSVDGGSSEDSREQRDSLSHPDPSETTQSGDTFLDEWLRKRNQVEPGPRVKPSQANPDSSALGELSPGKLGTLHAPPTSWSDVIGPVMRVEAAASYLKRSPARLRGDASRHRIMILKTLQGTEVIPASHLHQGSVVPGLSQLLPILERAPFGSWTRAAWLATPSAALGGFSPLAYLRTNGELSLVIPLVETYAEEF